ncbi:unnamed protein product [Acanthosepion pharaonis]|uniref:DUF7041 domain-containing protein n=1 Tax=Acanthosepion pharaonis TaxID=158019 RepID=A0A812E2U7_ACAPH|nr:unnamed protein product [Sepia pharaonis]
MADPMPPIEAALRLELLTYSTSAQTWFVQLDAIFQARHITLQQSKFAFVMEKLPADVASEVADILTFLKICATASNVFFVRPATISRQGPNSSLCRLRLTLLSAFRGTLTFSVWPAILLPAWPAILLPIWPGNFSACLADEQLFCLSGLMQFFCLSGLQFFCLSGLHIFCLSQHVETDFCPLLALDANRMLRARRPLSNCSGRPPPQL